MRALLARGARYKPYGNLSGHDRFPGLRLEKKATVKVSSSELSDTLASVVSLFYARINYKTSTLEEHVMEWQGGAQNIFLFGTVASGSESYIVPNYSKHYQEERCGKITLINFVIFHRNFFCCVCV